MNRKKKRAVWDREQGRFMFVDVSSDLDKEVEKFVAETKREPLPGQAEISFEGKQEKT